MEIAKTLNVRYEQVFILSDGEMLCMTNQQINRNMQSICWVKIFEQDVK